MNNNFDISPIKILNELSKPIWGIMTAQHMVEHLIDSIKISNGKEINKKCMNEEKRFPLLKRILLSNKPLPKNFVNTVVGAELKELKCENLEKAKIELNSQLNDFENYYITQPNKKLINPTFGPLNKEEWIIFHNKHFLHHFKQFILIGVD